LNFELRISGITSTQKYRTFGMWKAVVQYLKFGEQTAGWHKEGSKLIL
jgi:hypothetical protein